MTHRRRTPPTPDGAVASFLVESYAADPAAAIAVAGPSARAASDALSSPGRTVRYRGSIAVPSDEQAFHLFEGGDAGLVREVCGLAGIPCDRLVEALAAVP